MSFSLYELTGRYKELLEFMEGSEDAEQFTDTLAMLEDDIHTKADNITRLIKSLDAEVKMIEEEKKRLESRIGSQKNKIEHLKAYLQENLINADIEKMKTPLFSVWIQNNPPSVDIADEAKIDEKYRVKQPDKIDRKGVLEALKAGEEVEGAEIKQTRGLRFR